MPEALTLSKIRIQPLQNEGTHSGIQKSPTVEDRRTPRPKPGLKKSVSFNNSVKVVQKDSSPREHS
jgi:hypothetical protein